MSWKSRNGKVDLPIAPGAHIVVRDAVWRVLKVDPTSHGTDAWHVVGVDEIVRDQEAIFLEEYDPDVQVLDPARTELVLDTSSGHRASLLHMESLLRDVPPTGPELHIGHRGAMDVMDFQLDPARMALSQPRPRILIADAVGLGKTLEAGILISELIRRGRGKRILVATVKSMLTQFQKELWCRFAIPLVRLDSVGLQRIRQQIPTNHNPFHYYDRVIISIDTLKQNNAFRTHVEKASWDIIVIDEAHNVAVRGGGRSQRARIAEVLAERSDALILLSATPHDGKARSFASLMNMLDPTAIANPDEYSPKEIEGLFVRRFKKDVQEQVGKAFPERSIAIARATASEAEERAYAALTGLTFTRIDQRAHGDMLFKTTLEKALFSSPAACRKTIEERIKRLQARSDADEFREDVAQLEGLDRALAAITVDDFSKYGRLLHLVQDKKQGFGWTPRSKDDRLVLFSERIETLRFLLEHLSRDLKLKDDQVAILHGGLPDVEQQRLVEEFGKSSSKLRLLLASDVASEGLNLHYLCHRLIHFDVPWSLMVFQQRNGRIDRYGQEREPQIRYLVTDTENAEIRGDTRILELLIERDEQATKNIGDPSALQGVYDIDEQERRTARAMERNLSVEQFDEELGQGQRIDPLELLLSGAFETTDDRPAPPREPLSLFANDFAYVKTTLGYLAETEGLEASVREEEALIELPLPADPGRASARQVPGLDLRRRFQKLPPEILPEDGVLLLTPKTDTMQEAIANARREEHAWPRFHYLWPLHPVVTWCQDKVRGTFSGKRNRAPVLTLRDGIRDEEAVIVVSGLIPNRRSQPLVHRWFAVRFEDGVFRELEDFGDFQERLHLGREPLPNRSFPVDLEALQRLVPLAVERTHEAMLERRERFEQEINAKLQLEIDRLEELERRQLAEIERQFAKAPMQAAERDRRTRRVKRTFANYLDWVQDTMTSEDVPFLQVIAVLRSERGYGGTAR